MPVIKIRKDLDPEEFLDAKGLMYQDLQSVTPCQRKCMTRFGMTIQMEQEAYLYQHPEVLTMLKLFISEMVHSGKRKDQMLRKAGKYFSRPVHELAKEILQYQTDKDAAGCFVKSSERPQPQYHHDDYQKLEQDVFNSIVEHYPADPWDVPTSMVSPANTESSSFVSILTSASTLPTPENSLPLEPTIYETMYSHLSNTVDKVVYMHVNDEDVLYDTAYITLMDAVEQAMEAQVEDIKEEIALMFFNAFHFFELHIMEKEKLAANIAWEERTRKKMKKAIRRAENFKGWATPPYMTSESNDESQKTPEVPCACHPHFHYNRYPKDRFGVYLPSAYQFTRKTVTLSPVTSVDDFDVKSISSWKSEASQKSFVSRRLSKVSKTSEKSGVSKKTGLSVAFSKN